MSIKTGDQSSTKFVNNLHSVFIQEYSLNSEFNLLKSHVGPGIYIIPAAKTPFIWFGVIFIWNGVYKKGIFRFRLFIPHTFPECSECPKLVFESIVFHPQVNPDTHELCLENNPHFDEWRKDTNHLWEIICYMKSIFHHISVENAADIVAAELFETDKENFLNRVKDCVDRSKIQIYNKCSYDDPHYLLFDEYNSSLHDAYREVFRKEKNLELEEGRPITWIQLGSFEPLSKHN